MIRPASHVRNIFIAACAVLLVVALSGLGAPFNVSVTPVVRAAPLQQLLTFELETDTIGVAPNSSVIARATLTNTSSVTDTYDITTNIDTFPDWSATIAPAPVVTIGPGASQQIEFLINAPNATGESISLVVGATSQTTTQSVFDLLTVNVVTDSPTPTPTPTPTLADIGINLVVLNDDDKEGPPGSTVNYDLRVTNTGDERITVRISIDRSCAQDIDQCSESIDDTSITLDGGASDDFGLDVDLPDEATADAEATTRVIAEVSSPAGVNVSDTARVVTSVIAPSPTRTETPTRTNTPTETPTLGPVCVDLFETDDDRGSAKVIDVNLPQPQLVRDPAIDDRRAICPAGDEDWLVFGGIQDKVYTIDVRDVAPGIDLTLELFDEDGNSIVFNDDYYDRDPANPNPNDIDPRIDSWTAPYTGRYYIKVRDAADRGGVDRTYRIELIAESYGPTPQTVNEVCEDLFEPDGLPEQAKLIVYNELQEDRRLCPTGDADWVTFFGKQDKRYFLYTDTRPYLNNNPVSEMEAGADTVIVLTDRDGVSVLDVNDDIPGGSTLDSQIEFVPEVDGFYFLQVKNVGDIGNQFIRYDLVLELCIPGSDICGRDISVAARSVAPAPIPAASAPTNTPTFTPTLTDEEFDLDGTPTPEGL